MLLTFLQLKVLSIFTSLPLYTFPIRECQCHQRFDTPPLINSTVWEPTRYIQNTTLKLSKLLTIGCLTGAVVFVSSGSAICQFFFFFSFSVISVMFQRSIPRSSFLSANNANPKSTNRIFIRRVMAKRICSYWDLVLTYSSLLFVENVSTKIRLFRFNYLLADLNMFNSSATEIVKEARLPVTRHQHAHHQHFCAKIRFGFHFWVLLFFKRVIRSKPR